LNFTAGKIILGTQHFKIHNTMKKTILTSILFIATFSLNAQNTKTVTTGNDAIDQSAPEISFEHEIHDFGTIPYSGNGTIEFKFKNTGKSPLIISSATGSCGCTVPTYPKEPIRSGEGASIKVTYDTKRVGAFTKTVTVNSNAKTPTKVITIKGTVMSQEETDNQMPLKKSDKAGTPLEVRPASTK